MPLTNRPYQVKLFHALNIYRDVMRKFIIRQLQQSPTSPMDAIRNSLWNSATEQFDKNFRVDDDLETTIDVGWFKTIVEGNWNSAFASAFVDEKGRVLSDLDRISDIRNKVVHPKKHDINRRESLNALETIEQILRSVDALAEVDAVRKISEDNPEAQAIPVQQYAITSADVVQRIAETVAQRVAPIVYKSQPTSDLTEDMRQALGKRVVDELTPLVESIKFVQGQAVEEIVGRIEPLLRATKESENQQVMPQATEEITEALAELNQGFRALEARVTDAFGNADIASHQPKLSPSLVSKPPSEGSNPPSIADLWLGVIDELRVAKVTELTLGSLLRGCRPIDVWIQRDPEKLILPFRNDFHLNSMKKVCTDPRGKELIKRAIAKHFGIALDFECVLDRPLPL